MGTTGQSKRMEAIQLAVTGADLGMKYCSHIQDIGWQDWKTGDNISGTTGQSKRVEGIRIELTGNNAQNYDLYYRAHIQNYGWLDWAANGTEAGSEGLSLRMEALEIVVVSKGAEAPGKTDRPFVSQNKAAAPAAPPAPESVSPASLSYAAHVANIGWQNSVTNGKTTGTTGRSLRMEAIKIQFGSGTDNGIKYRSHVANIGWQNWVSNGAVSGTTGRSLQMEAIEIKLTGNAASNFDIYYRAHVADYGWLGWASNGAPAGTSGLSIRMEALEIVVVNKNAGAPGSTSNSYIDAIVPAGSLGVDVSEWNGSNDWNAAKNAGVKFAFLRCAWGWEGIDRYGKKAGDIDARFEENYQRVRAAGIPVGVYLYSYALDVEEAKKEADFALKILKGRHLDLPVVFDIEDKTQTGFSVSKTTDIVVAFCEKIKAAGYKPMVYSYYSFLNNKIDYNRIASYPVWMAHHSSSTDYPKRYEFWQYTSSGYINGIGGVDLNKAMVNYK